LVEMIETRLIALKKLLNHMEEILP